MKLLAIFRFEFGYQVRRPWPWILFVALVVITALFVRTNYVADRLYEEYFANATFLIAGSTVFGGLIWLLAAGAIAGEAGARDVTTRMYPLTYTTPVSRAAYLGGRFLAALAINALLLGAVQVGVVLAIYTAGLPEEQLAPFRLAAYLTPYAFISLINALAATALQFSMAALSGRPVAAYFGCFLLFFAGYFISAALLFWQWWGFLLDPIGIRFVVEELGRAWTPIEKNSRLIWLEGSVLQNRLVWLGVAMTMMALTYWRFRFTHRAEGGLMARIRARRSRRPVRSPTPARIGASAPTSVPAAARHFGLAVHAKQAIAIGWVSFRAIAMSWAGLAFFVAIPLMAVPVVVDQMESGGAERIPVTALVIGELTGSLSDELSRWLIVPLLIIYFAGEVVWRERDAGLGDITDTMPGSEWAPLSGKFFGLALAVSLFMTLLILAGMAAQTILGYGEYEVEVYVQTLLGLQLAEYLLFAVLALAVHMIVHQKYAGHLVAVGIYVFMAMPGMFGVEHSMIVYGAGLGWSYTQMRGFGPSLEPWLWFALYWAGWALLIAVIARLLWIRGSEARLALRLAAARRRLTPFTLAAATAAFALIATVGGVIVYNTHVLNAYVSASVIAARQAEYERRYVQYARVAQPRIESTELHVEIYPDRRAAEIRGAYRLVNRTRAPIGTIHVATAPGVETGAITFDRVAATVLADEVLFHRIYTLERPLDPGESLQLAFDVRAASRGFRHSGISDAIVENGTHFRNAWLPAIGYRPDRELLSASDRREQGLPSRPIIAPLDDPKAAHDRENGTTVDVVVGTAADQTAVAPGALKRTWLEADRRYFHYATGTPIPNAYAIFSARYAAHEMTWRQDSAAGAVAIRIFHHPTHTANVGRIAKSILASLDYYAAQFGPYPYQYLSFVERGANGAGMHADPGMVTFTEGSALWKPAADGGDLDFTSAIVAHETAHQWTVPYAAVEGAPVMSESIAWYYGMRAVEHAKGVAELDRLRRFMRQPQPFPPTRRGEPLLRGLDGYMSYRRGPFALYTLSEYVGVDAVNAALRRLLAAYRLDGAPLATTRDLFRELQAVTPPPMQGLLRDLFEVNTFWELETDRVEIQQTGDGAWQVTLDIDARKVVYDEGGAESEVPVDDLVEVGVFAGADVIYLQTHRIGSGNQTITVQSLRQPDRAGIDPRFLLIDTEHDDNVRAITDR